MNKIFKISLTIMLTFSIGLMNLIFSQTTIVYAKGNEISFEEKSYCTATLEDDFADNRVLVALNKTATMKFKQYTLDDFLDIGCISVEDMTKTTVEIVKQQI